MLKKQELLAASTLFDGKNKLLMYSPGSKKNYAMEYQSHNKLSTSDIFNGLKKDASKFLLITSYIIPGQCVLYSTESTQYHAKMLMKQELLAASTLFKCNVYSLMNKKESCHGISSTSGLFHGIEDDVPNIYNMA